ncbi:MULTISPECIES: hypothetical protein [unclassified Mycobacterium]|uniref:hypothetical protein n=1 Tax=unclassified Mycobacterium TaxID=2642494 RepID=UPI0029C853F4|nr:MULTISPECIES: hypothetical protein [unclassified Mycobacterium]
MRKPVENRAIRDFELSGYDVAGKRIPGKAAQPNSVAVGNPLDQLRRSALSHWVEIIQPTTLSMVSMAKKSGTTLGS